jgi:hypothetical protein
LDFAVAAPVVASSFGFELVLTVEVVNAATAVHLVPGYY